MAITIHANPKDFAPVYNKMEYLIESTNSAEPNFAYLVDIYINGSGTKTVRLRVPVRPSDNYGKVDIHRVLESALTSNVGSPTGVAGTYSAANSSLSYIVKFGEEYGTTVVQYPDLTVDSSRKAFNASLEKRPFINWDVTEYELDGITKKFLTNMPDNNKVSINSHGWLYYIENVSPSTTITHFNINGYDASGNFLYATEIDATASSGDIQFVPSSPASLNNIDNANILVGSQPIINSNIASYNIQARGVGLYSETRTFVIEESCKYNSNTLIFQNNLGAFDSFTFYLGDMSTTDIERKDMKVNVDTVVSNDIVYSMNEREKVTYYTKKSETIKLMSDWITEAESNWLLELMSSPEIYLQEGNELVAVAKIKATNYTKKKVVRDKLFKIDVELELGYDDYRQRI
jgi:hypothetical protein